ncbi:hypothetical protein ACMFMF_000991 [Clarireedia jacksonii]
MESKEHIRTHSSSDEENLAASSGIQPVNLANLPEDPDAHLSPEERRRIDKRLVWKLDFYLIPWACVECAYT